MSDNNINKMPPDPQFEKLGWQGWHYFKEKLVSIFRDYKEYGDIVLEKKLGESIEIYRPAFESERFVDAIFEIWKERYQYVVKSLSDWISRYDILGNKYLSPDIFMIAKEQNFSLSPDLYDYIVRIVKKHGADKVVVLKENNVYKFSLERRDDEYYEIKLVKLDVIEVE